jgi:hypothetical protein
MTIFSFPLRFFLYHRCQRPLFLTLSDVILLIWLSGFIPVTGIAFPSCPSEKKGKDYPFFWQSAGVADGLPGEWPLDAFFLSKDGSILYATGNDSLRFFMCMKLLLEQQQFTLMQEGLSLWFDPSGKKNSDCSVRVTFKPLRPEPVQQKEETHSPGTMSRPGSSPSGAPPQGRVPNGSGQTMNKNNQRFSGVMVLQGFVDSLNGVWPAGHSLQTVQSAMAFDSAGILTMEFSVLLIALPAPAKPSACITLGFELQATHGTMGGDPSRNNPGDGMNHSGGRGMPGGGGGMPGGGSGMPGGGGSGGIPGGGRDGMQERPEGGMNGSPSGYGRTETTAKTVSVNHRFALAPHP